MFGLARLVLQFVWLGIMVLGVRKAMEIARQGVDDLVYRIEEGDSSGLAGTVVRVYDALQRRAKATRDVEPEQGPDVYGEL